MLHLIVFHAPLLICPGRAPIAVSCHLRLLFRIFPSILYYKIRDRPLKYSPFFENPRHFTVFVASADLPACHCFSSSNQYSSPSSVVLFSIKWLLQSISYPFVVDPLLPVFKDYISLSLPLFYWRRVTQLTIIPSRHFNSSEGCLTGSGTGTIIVFLSLETIYKPMMV